MQQLQKVVQSRPDLKSDRSDYLKLAVKDAGGAVRGTGPHKVKVISCENATSKDYKTQQAVKGVNLLFEENGVVKKYFVPTLGDDGKFHYLIERFADIEERTEIVMEYQRKPGSTKGFINVQLANEASESIPGEPTVNIDDGEIPVIEEDETPPGDIKF